jgi:FtsZ-binding cell division protein ZapB
LQASLLRTHPNRTQKTNIINKLQDEVDVLKRKRDDLEAEESKSTKGREETVPTATTLWCSGAASRSPRR